MRVRGAGRVGFLALRTTIAAELAAGWPMAEVFRRHQAELGIKVGQFRAYVKRYIAADSRWTGNDAAATVAAAAPASQMAISPRPVSSDPSRLVTRSINLKHEDLI
jgi:hypothetical protein